MSFSLFEATLIHTLLRYQDALHVGVDSIVLISGSGPLIDQVGSDDANEISLLVVDEKTITMQFPLLVVFILLEVILEHVPP